MQVLGMSPVRVAVSGLGAAAGLYASQNIVYPLLARQFPNVFSISNDAALGVDDWVDGIMAVLGAAVANKVFSGIQG